MGIEVDTLCCPVRTVRARIWFLASVSPKVCVEVVTAIRGISAHRAGEGLLHIESLQGDASY